MQQDSSVLNTLRAAAILLVVANHIAETRSPIHPFDYHLGRLGVLLFFVHTSCVLMMSLERTQLEGLRRAWHFYVRRVFRIYPLSILTVLLVVAFGVPPRAWDPALPDPSFRSVVANVLLVQDLAEVESVTAPLWSLPLELQMYLLLPAVFVFIRKGASLGRAAVIWVAGLALAVTMPRWPALSQFVPCFLSGVVTYCLARRVAPRLPFWTWPIALTGLIAAYVGMAALSGTVHPAPVAWVICLAAGVLLPMFRETAAPARAVPAWIAKYSYGIYLSHMVTLYISFRVLSGAPWVLQWVAFLGLTTGISVISFHLVESPLIRLGARVANRLTMAPVVTGATAASPSSS